MLNKHKQTIVLFTLLLTLISCGDDDDDDTFTPTLPAITQTGENTFGCYVDGNLLTPRDGTGTFNNSDRGMRFWVSPPPGITYDELHVKDFKSGTGGIIKIHFDNLDQNGEGAFTINESNCEDGIDAIDNINITCRWLDEITQTYKWYCSIENGGSLIITHYDSVNRIVSGTFNCTMQNREDASDIIEITQGRFDIKRLTLENTNFP